MNERDLLSLKNRIEQAKSKVSELKGRKNYLLQELQDKWNCNTMQQAEIKITELKTQISELNKQINAGIIKLTEEMNQ